MSSIDDRIRLALGMPQSPVKRKAIAAIDTACIYCGKVWTDKIYTTPHKVICPYCERQQYTDNGIPVILDRQSTPLECLAEWSFTRDVANSARYGNHLRIGQHGITADRAEELLGLKHGALGHRKGFKKTREVE